MIIKKNLNFIFVFLFITLFNISLSQNKIYAHADFSKNINEQNLVEQFDYAFEGLIKGVHSVSQYNGYGTDIPYTYFDVNVKNVLKGQIEQTVIIKYYGGYIDNNLVLLENMIYPKVNEIYMFYCNKTNLSYSDDYRTIKGSYVVAHPLSINKLDSNSRNNSKMSKVPNINNSFECHGGNLDNYSFETAATLSKSFNYSVRSDNKDLYFKYIQNRLDYISIYTKGNSDTELYIYDQNYNLLYSNDNVKNTDRHTNGLNSKINFYCNKDTLYYIKVKSKTISEDNFIVTIEKDNYYNSNPTNLFLGYNSVDSNRNVHYKTTSKFSTLVYSAVDEWQKLNNVKFIKDEFITNNDVKFLDYYDNDTSAPIAICIQYPIVDSHIKLNCFYFDTMTNDERMKTILHEIGHILGLNEFTDYEEDNNVMVQGIRPITKLGPADIAIYDYLWPNISN